MKTVRKGDEVEGLKEGDMQGAKWCWPLQHRSTLGG